MAKQEAVSYVCPNCGYTNTWTRTEIQRQGFDVIYRGVKGVDYTLRCRNPKVNCDHHNVVTLHGVAQP